MDIGKFAVFLAQWFFCSYKQSTEHDFVVVYCDEAARVA